MRTLIEDYRNHPGEHCGSVAMRGLLEHYTGLALPEPAVFGLGAGCGAGYFAGPGLDPAAMLFGRTATLEQDLTDNLQVEYHEQPEPDDDRAWQLVREEVLAGRPTMLTGDILYLDYREYKVHFPSHRFVLLGFDDEAEQVFIADRINEAPETCSMGALRRSRNPPEGISTRNLWGRFVGREVGRPLVDAARRAIAQCAAGMLAPGDEPVANAAAPTARAIQGLAAIRAYAADLPDLGERDDAAAIAGFNASCLEKFGNGGGNFRRLYARFLEWARALDPGLVPESAPALCLRAADAWTEASNALYAAAQEAPGNARWRVAAGHVERAAALEQALFERLAEAAPGEAEAAPGEVEAAPGEAEAAPAPAEAPS